MEGNRYGHCTYQGSWKTDDPRLCKVSNRPTKPIYTPGHQVNGDLHPHHGSVHGGNSSVKGHSKKDYKLLIDPAIKKGHHKVYRYDGALEGGQPITLRDPRPPKSRLWTFCQAELPVPRFKVDKYYVGQVPETTVRFGCLNDNVDKRFLHELCSKFGDIEECKVYYDPKTKKHLGTGKCIFTRSAAAKQAVLNLNGTSVMGNRIYVTLERPKISDSKRHQGSHGAHSHVHNSHSSRRHSSSSSASVSASVSASASSIASGHDSNAFAQRDPRLLFPTPSPSSASSIESTPPTPAIGWNNRHHPVASLKSEAPAVPGRRLSLTGRDYRSFPTPSPGSTMSTPGTSSRSFEPVSPPATGYPHHSQTAPLPPAPLPPSDKEEPPPPPPPPPSIPSKSSIEYEDISPSNNFEENHSSFSSPERTKGTKLSKENTVYGNSAATRVSQSESSRKASSLSALGNERRPLSSKSKDLSSSNAHSSKATPALLIATTTQIAATKDIKIAVYENIDSPDYKAKDFNLTKSKEEPKYEAISDSEEQQGSYEDISPVNSPQPTSLDSHSKPNVATGTSQVSTTAIGSLNPTAALTSVEPGQSVSVDCEDKADDDDDDAMSLSSISSNEETPLELNTPAPTVQTAVVPPASSVSTMPVPPLPFGARISVPPPPMYPPIPPPRLPVGRPLAALPRGPPPPPPPPPTGVIPPYPRYPPNYPPPGFGSSRHMPPPVARGMPMFYTSLFPQGVPPARGAPIPPPTFSSGFMPPTANSPIKETKSQLPFKFQARESSSKAIDKDLKSVLSRHVMKRLVEQSGFKAFETWWDNQVKSKSKVSAATSSVNSTPSNIISPLTPCKMESKEKSNLVEGASTSLINDLLGVLGKPCTGPTHGGFAKLPSFRIARKTAAPTAVHAINDLNRKRNASESSDMSQAKSQRVDLSDEDDDDEEFDDIGLASHIAKSKRDTMTAGKGHIRESVSVYDTVYSSGSDEESDSDQEDKEIQPDADTAEKDMEMGENSERDEKEEMEDVEEDDDDDSDDELHDLDLGEDGEEDLSDEEYSSYSEEEDDEEEEEVEEEEEEKRHYPDKEHRYEEGRSSASPQPLDRSGQDLSMDISEPQPSAPIMEEPGELADHSTEEISQLKKSEVTSDVLAGKCEELPVPIGEADTAHVKSIDSPKVEELSPSVPVREEHLQLTSTESGSTERVQEGETLQKVPEEQKEPSISRTDIIDQKAGNELHGSFEESQDANETEKVVSKSEKSVLSAIDNTQKVAGENKNLWNTLITDHSYSGLVDAVANDIALEKGDVKGDIISMKEHDAVKVEFLHQAAYPDSETLKPKGEIDSPDLYINGDKNILFPSSAPFNDSHSLLDEPKPFVSKYNFPMRTIEEENNIVNDILLDGLDLEDVGYLKKAFESLQLMGSEVVEGLNWCPHPETRTAPQRSKKSKSEPRVHLTGSARSEGYYKITDREKADYLPSVQKQFITKGDGEIEEDEDGTKHKSQSRDNRVMQRRLASSFVNEDLGDLVKFNQFKIRKKHLRFAKSHIHNWGLFACEPIAAEEMVIEYVGEVIRSIAADQREKRYEEIGIGSSYLFRMDAELVIDATKSGNLARFINHCCTPNCYAKIISVEGEKKIVIYSKRDIKLNEEITYDYKFPIEDEKIPCLCGAPQCRGTLN